MEDCREASAFDQDDWISQDGHLLSVPEWAGQGIWDDFPGDVIS